MKRPVIWVAGILFAFFLITMSVSGEKLEEKYYSMDQVIQENPQGEIRGTLDHIEVKPKSYYFYLKKVSVTLTDREKIYYFSDFLAILSQCQKDSYQPGNIVQISGSVQPFTSPTNPGQFDEKSYYKEKNIYYKVFGDACQVLNPKRNLCLSALYQGKDTLKRVYEKCLPEKEAGIITAMLLGDKSTLDMDVRELYQVNGIGHLLAISGLHVSILCMVLYEGLRRCFLPKRLPFLLTVCFLLAYGRMTGFGISTSRAVIMMLLFLLGKEWGKSYDALTAMGISAVIIWLQNPYAIFSSSFLLSYGAMAGVYLVLPAMEIFFYGTEKEQQAALRKRKRKRRELAANNWWGRVMLLLLKGKEKIVSSLLGSLSIWLATLPVLCYFFYEYPTYGILLNLLVLPLASLLVISGMAGGVLGAFFLPAGKCILWIVQGILVFYENICELFQKLPHPIQITGCPKGEYIFIYYLILFLLCLVIGKGMYRREHFIKHSRTVMLCCILLGMGLLLFPERVQGFSCTVMDVGQGDGILIRHESGLDILIDGGSTDTSQVGKYRILPYLKYSGIRTLEYLIITHEDEDHISGQLELLEQAEKNGISIGCLLMPEPDKECTGDNYLNIQNTALKAGVPIRFIHTGDQIVKGNLRLLCLHPGKGFLAQSANAYSTTISLTYGEISMLFTGDLEKNGEDALLKELQSGRYPVPDNYTFLKTAHHGSKNSTREDLLDRIHPVVCGISCGRNNRYGHPHPELLERLANVGAESYITSENGAIFLKSDGRGLQVKTFLE